MPTGPRGGLGRYLFRAALRRDGGPSDGELLERFVARRDEAAFEALLQRHGPMVLGVCHRVLCSAHDAEDAFQATFLVLVRKAHSIVPRQRVGNWLYGVAYRTALEARAAAARRRAKERQAPPPDCTAAAADEAADWRPLLDRELNRLPEAYRAAVLLCDVEGRPRKEAARQLGWPEGTLSCRLARARQLLARRLARYGPPVSGAVLAAALAREARAGVPASLLDATARAAAGGATVPVSAPVLTLTEGVLKAMFLTRTTRLTGALLVLVAAGIGAGLLTQAALGQRATPAPRAAADDDTTRGYLGLAVAAELDDDKVLVQEVAPDSPAAKAGLKEGDHVLQVNGENVADAQALIRKIGALKPGDEATIRYDRSVKVKLGKRPEKEPAKEPAAPAGNLLSVVALDVEYPDTLERGKALGAVLDGDGYVVSAWAALKGARRARVVFGNGAIRDARPVGKDEGGLGFLRLEAPPPAGPTVFRWADAGSVRLGDPVWAARDVRRDGLPLDPGVVKALHRDVKVAGTPVTGLLQVDGPAVPGAPVLNRDHEVIGVSIFPPGGPGGLDLVVSGAGVREAHQRVKARAR